MAMIDMLCAVSPLDGRYGSKVDELREVFSEYGLVKRRVAVECAWLAALCAHPGLPECPPLAADEADALARIADGFTVADAQRVKDIEKTTNHDVKAVEYFIKERIAGTPLAARGEFVHFGCTSEDINNPCSPIRTASPPRPPRSGRSSPWSRRASAASRRRSTASCCPRR